MRTLPQLISRWARQGCISTNMAGLTAPNVPAQVLGLVYLEIHHSDWRALAPRRINNQAGDIQLEGSATHNLSAQVRQEWGSWLVSWSNSLSLSLLLTCALSLPPPEIWWVLVLDGEHSRQDHRMSRGTGRLR